MLKMVMLVKVSYYMQKNGLILPGTTISIDEMDLKGELAVLFKKMTTTRFQTGAEQRVVIDGEVFELKMPPRLAIWTSSVDMQGDEQLRDRFLSVPIDEKQTAAIINFMKGKDKAPQNDDDKKFENAVCRGLFSDLASKTFHVEIPFDDDFEFRVVGASRGKMPLESNGVGINSRGVHAESVVSAFSTPHTRPNFEPRKEQGVMVYSRT